MERITGHRANHSVLKDLTGRVVRGEPIVVSDWNLGRDYTYVRLGPCQVGTVNFYDEAVKVLKIVAGLAERLPNERPIMHIADMYFDLQACGAALPEPPPYW